MALSKCLNIWNNVWFQTFCWCCCLEIHDIDKRENESVISSMCDLIITNTYFFFSKDVCGSRQQMVFAQFSIYSNITLMKVSVVWFYDQISDPKKKNNNGCCHLNKQKCLPRILLYAWYRWVASFIFERVNLCEWRVHVRCASVFTHKIVDNFLYLSFIAMTHLINANDVWKRYNLTSSRGK